MDSQSNSALRFKIKLKKNTTDQISSPPGDVGTGAEIASKSPVPEITRLKGEKVKKTQSKRSLSFALTEEETGADILAIAGGEQEIAPESIAPPKREKAKKNQKKRRFSFALSLEEIEADILAVTGERPTIQVKKRAKKIPKEIENLFPCFKGFN